MEQPEILSRIFKVFPYYNLKKLIIELGGNDLGYNVNNMQNLFNFFKKIKKLQHLKLYLYENNLGENKENIRYLSYALK